jgi:MerR family transcriptional regulator, light-induced transcriptional regulator
MLAPDLKTRVRLAEHLRFAKATLAEAVTEQFFQRHPDWQERYGDRGRQRGIEDAAFHLDFLAGAIECGEPAAFARYAHWTVGVLQARGIAPHFVAENLEQLSTALRDQITPEQQSIVDAYIRAGTEACTLPGRGLDAEEPETGLAITRELFLQAILRGERKAATGIALESLREGFSVCDLYTDVLQEALYAVGRLWETNQITVAKEHMATAVVQAVMAQLYERLPLPAHTQGKVVLTGVQGEFHQVGANMVADLLEADGWSVCFLGTNMPHAGILDAVAEQQADVVGISTTMLFNVPRVRELIADIRNRFQERPPRILVGGAAFRLAPTLWQEIGADGYAPDLRTLQSVLGTTPAPFAG